MVVYLYTRLNDILIGKIQQKKEDNPNISKSELGRLFGVSHSSITKALGTLPGRVPQKRKARLPSAAIRERRKLVKTLSASTEVVNGRTYLKHASAQAIADELSKNHRIDVDKTVVWRDTKALGLKAYIRVKVPTRDPRVYLQRLRFARSQIARGKKRVRSLIFSDEHVQPANEYNDRFQYLPSDGSKQALPREHKSNFNVACFQVWGCISYNYKSQLFFFPKKNNDEEKKSWRLNSDRYIRKCLAPMISDLQRKGLLDERTFQQDGARCHVSKRTKAYLERKGVDFIDNWPPYSPDLSPIEHLWANMKIRVSRMHPVGDEQLKGCIQKYWDELTFAEINRYIDGFWAKMQRCRDAGGKPAQRKFKA